MKDNCLFDLLNDIEESNLPFVAYREPNKKTIKMVVQNNQILDTLSDMGKSGFVFAPFDDKMESIIFDLNNSKYFETEYKHKECSSLSVKLISTDNYSKQKHMDLVNGTVSFINETGRVDKIVISRKEINKLDDEIDKKELFESLLNKYIDAFVYIWYHPKVGTWLGASPEVLLKTRGDEFETMALAGTQVYKENEANLWSDKEIKEQKYVQDYISKTCNDIGLRTRKSKIYNKKAGKLVHICTDIKGTLNKDISLNDLIGQLHPTPAVCGTPKDLSKEYILDKESYNRNFYTGFLGEINIENKSNLYVNLRCLELEKDNINLYIGGGITKDSNAEDEWEETVNKAKTIKSVFAD